MGDIAIFEKERASGYDNFVQAWIPNYQFIINSIPAILGTTSNKPLLVAGCGTGNEILAFKRYRKEWDITGVDPSQDMVSQARSKLKDYSKVQLLKGEVKDLSSRFQFGAATLLLVLHFLKDDGTKLQLLQDISERLESGSPLILFDIFGTGKVFKENLSMLQYFIPPEIEADEKQTRMERIENALYNIDEDRLFELLVQAGFNIPLKFYQASIYGCWIARKT
ncbi:MAG: class I SAM-dependent methyltransferase [Bacteroidota bacterium]